MPANIKNVFCAIDLSGPHSGLSLSLNGAVIESLRFDITPRNNSVFLKHFFGSLEKNGLAADDISRWIVGIGPGSFTGLRIASAFVSGMCLGNPPSVSHGMPTAFPVAAKVLNSASGVAKILFHASSDSLIVCKVRAEKNKFHLDDIGLFKADTLRHITGCDVVAFITTPNMLEICEKYDIDMQNIITLNAFPSEKMLEIEMSEEYSIVDLLYVRPAAAVMAKA